MLYETAIRRNEAILAADGPLVARTGQHTGRSPLDKFTVKEPTTEMNVHWGSVNRPVDEVHFDVLHRDMMNYVQDKELYVLDADATPPLAVMATLMLAARVPHASTSVIRDQLLSALATWIW